MVQQALVQKINPIFEPLFADCSFGYRPGRSPHMAMRKVWREIQEGNFWISDADLRAYFDGIDQNRLVDLICESNSDGRVLQLIRDFLEAGVIADGGWEPTKTGVPQGGVAGPALVEHFPDALRSAMTAAGYRVTRWADDFVVVCRTRQEAQSAQAMARSILRNQLGVGLHAEKTQIVHVDHRYEFLGYKVKSGKGLRLSPPKRTGSADPPQPLRRPRGKVGGQVKDQIRDSTQRRAPVRLRDVIEVINPVIRGCRELYRKTNVRSCP